MTPTKPPKVVLYMRPDCHLCSDALTILHGIGCTVNEVNIDDDPDLRRRYGFRVPVMTVDGVDLLWGIFTEAKVRAALAGGRRAEGRCAGP